MQQQQKRSVAIGKVCMGLTINTEETAGDDLKVKERNNSREKNSISVKYEVKCK